MMRIPRTVVPLGLGILLSVPVGSPATAAGIDAPTMPAAELPADVQLSVDVAPESAGQKGYVADGRSVTVLSVRLADSEGKVPAYPRYVTYSLSGIDSAAGGGTAKVENGVAKIRFVAPISAGEVQWTVSAAGQLQSGRIVFSPELRPMVAAGLVEGVIWLDREQRGSLGQMAGLSDGLERELRRWERSFNNGRSSIAGQTSFFAKGTVQENTAFTVMFDSEKELQQREFRAYKPDQTYPMLGDSSQRGYEAKTSDRFYLRLDRGRDYFMYGDFTTGSETPVRRGKRDYAPQRLVDLGQYSRTMTGMHARHETDKGYVDVFGMQDSLRQAVEEYRGNGTSGPFAVGNFNALENSEKVEVVVRDRNNTSRILTLRALDRYADYTFEPFSGRILLKAPLSAFDDDLNPVSLRITYEVDTGGAAFWVYGISAQRKIMPGVAIGASLIRNENPLRPLGTGFFTTPGSGVAEVRQLSSVNMSAAQDWFGSLIIEAAQSTAMGVSSDVVGTAARFDWRYGEQAEEGWPQHAWHLRVFGGIADREFVNPSSSLAPGRTELAVQAGGELDSNNEVKVSGSYTQDDLTGGERTAVSASLMHQLAENWQATVGIREFSQRNGGVASLSPMPGSMVMPDQASAFGGPGLNPNGAGFWGLGTGLNPITGQPQSAFNGAPLTSGYRAPDLDVTTYMLGLNTRLASQWSVGGEVGMDQGFEGDPAWVAVNSDYRYRRGRAFARYEAPTQRATAGADVRITDAVALYGRLEQTNGLGSVYSIDESSRSKAFVAGLRQVNGDRGDVHSEIRLRDGMNASEVESAMGLRNSVPLNESMSANFSAERLEILRGAARSATALGGGVDFGHSALQGTTRLEWRRLDRSRISTLSNDSADSVMGTVSIARKLSSAWTGLLRDYVLTTNDHSRPGSQIQNRFQVGAAYRPDLSNSFDALFRYENKRERNSELTTLEARTVDILSTHINWHPTRSLWVSGRLAAKDLSETFGGVSDDYRAWLVSARLIQDIGQRFDVGVMASVLGDDRTAARQTAYGLEAGFRLKQNAWISAGRNFSGFSDRDLSGSEQTERGWYLRLRMKFDEKLLLNWMD